MKTEFIAIASHQLRTPLTALSWISESLLENESMNLTNTQLDSINDIHESSLRLISLVNSLLNVSHIEAGRIKIEPVSMQLDSLIKDIVGEMSTIAQEKNLQIELEVKLDEVPSMMADPNLLRQVFTNLIGNAIHYTLSNDLKIIVNLDLYDKNNYLVSVQDFGAGIKLADQDRVFSKFFRSDVAVKHRTDGSGLGLYITKTVVNLYGGKVWFESQEGKGSKFYVTIPKSGMSQREGSKSLI